MTETNIFESAACVNTISTKRHVASEHLVYNLTVQTCVIFSFKIKGELRQFLHFCPFSKKNLIILGGNSFDLK